MHFVPFLITSLTFCSTTGLAAYVLEDDYFSTNFFENFDFFESPDPTHGFVQYQSYNSALDAKIISNGADNIRMGVDSTNITPNGRPSVRITSKKSYGSGLIVLDVDHMPGGICGTWPAFWTVGPNWPNGGEIDIIEGVNDQDSNYITLHTGPGCSISNQENDYSGTMTSSTCTSSNDDNTGCQIASSSRDTYGESFNSGNGGVYTMEFSSSGINVHFFGRSSIPSDALSSAPDPSGWGIPMAYFSGSACNFGSSFTAQQIVFDTTFCGDWAGNTWSSSGCASQASSCNAFVQNNPDAFVGAYWAVNALKVYSNVDQTLPASVPPDLPSVVVTTASQVISTLSTKLSEPSFAIPTSLATGYQWIDVSSTAINGAESGWFSNGAGGVVDEWKREQRGEVGKIDQARDKVLAVAHQGLFVVESGMNP